MNRLIFLFDVLHGLFLKWSVSLGFLSIPSLKKCDKEQEEKIIVSLTSYGRRVEKIVYYSIVSILRQSKQPDFIVLYLDSWSWNDENLPQKIKELKSKGLIVKYSDEHIKSYKKLVPALRDYPNDIIITVDDDMYYRKNMVEQLCNAYYNNPNKVYCNSAYVIRTENNKILGYNNWEHGVKGASGKGVFLLGVNSCIYNSRLLYKDVLNVPLFTKLAPNADDIWFFFMELLNKTPRESLSYFGSNNYPLDYIYQRFHSDSCLSSSNCGLSQNDVQFQSIMSYYGLTVKDVLE